MFTTWDKAITAFVTSAVTIAIGAGLLSETQAGTLLSVVVPLVGAVVTALATYFMPNAPE